MDREFACLSPLREGNALHEFHCEPRAPVVESAPVQEARDVGVVEARQRLALPLEAEPHLLAQPPVAHQLDGDLVLVGAVGPPGHVDLPHAALAGRTEDLVGTDPRCGTGSLTRAGSHHVRLRTRVEQALDLSGHGGLLGSQPLQSSEPLLGLHLVEVEEVLSYLGPIRVGLVRAIRVHARL